jgi:hypothetical protein
MMDAIGPGDVVECIVECNENSPGISAHWLCGAEIIAGCVYTVMRVDQDVDNFGETTLGFVLTEASTHWPRSKDGELGAWSHHHFRPLYRRSEQMLRGLLQPADALEDA